MKKSSWLLLPVLLLSASLPIVAQQQQQQEQEPVLEPVEPIRPPRVVGQAQSPEELDAWNAVLNTASPQEKIQLSKGFLEQYAESGLISYVHKEMALSYYQTGDQENFVKHAEEALKELPNDPFILPSLARTYAEQGQAAKAMERAQQGMAAVQALQKPALVPADRWARQINQAKADVNYAQGLALLRRAYAMTGESSAIVKEAIERFNAAVELDPKFEYAYFRMASAYRRLNDADNTIDNYARVAALEGSASSIARGQLQQVFEILKKDASEIEKTIEEQRAYITSKVAEREAELQKLMEAEASAPAPPIAPIRPTLRQQ